MNPHLNDPDLIKAKKEAEAEGKVYVEDESWLKGPRRIRISML